MNERSLRVLEFTKIRAQLAQYCVSDMGKALCEALEYQVERTISGTVFTLAEIPLPGGGSIPLTVDVATLAGALGGGS